MLLFLDDTKSCSKGGGLEGLSRATLRVRFLLPLDLITVLNMIVFFHHPTHSSAFGTEFLLLASSSVCLGCLNQFARGGSPFLVGG